MPSLGGLRTRLRERLFGPGGRSPRQAAEVIRQFATEEVVRFCKAHQLGLDETVMRLADQPVSFARFGDGEWGSMLRPGYDLYLQRTTPALMAELRSVWTLEDLDPDRLMLGFPHPFTGPYWSKMWTSFWPGLRDITRTDIVYGNTHVTRPIFFRKMKQRGVQLWREVWADKAICIVTGTGQRFDLLPELFDGAASIVRENAPPVDAYAEVDALERRLLSIPADIHLLSLGPTATILAARLSRRGRRAIDIGHIVNSFKAVFRGEGPPEHQPL